MSLYLIGVDHRHAPIGVREVIYRKRGELAAFMERRVPRGAAILATCNRVEIYLTAEVSESTENRAQRTEKNTIYEFIEEFRPLFDDSYVAEGEAGIFRHLVRLASGLKSQLKGETQILRQLDKWADQKDFPAGLLKVWREARRGALRIRRASGLDREDENIARRIIDDIRKHKDGPGSLELVVVGTGKIAGAFAEIVTPDIRLYFVANKNRQKAQELAARSEGKTISFKDLPGILATADALVSATSSPHFVIGADELKAACKRGKTLYLYDVAVPRDIDPEAAALKGVVLKNLDDLSAIFGEHNERLSRNIALAEYLAEEAAGRYKEASDAKQITYRHAAEQIGD